MRILRSAIVMALPALVIVAASSAARAAFLDGHTLSITLIHQTLETDPMVFAGPVDVVVGDGVELPGFGFNPPPNSLPALVDVDFSDTQIKLSLLIDQPLAYRELFMIFDTNGSIPSFLGKTRLNPATTWEGFHTGLVRESEEQILIHVEDLQGLTGQYAIIDLVPEPASAGLAVMVLGIVGRRSRSSQRHADYQAGKFCSD